MLTFIADLETTVYEGQTETEAWASALIPITAEDETKNVIIHHSLLDTYNYLASLNTNVTLYYHNLKFDGQFWLSFLLTKLGYKQGLDYISPTEVVMKTQKQLGDKEVIYSISDMGQWYTVTFKIGKYTVTLKDSLKLIPLSVEAIGKAYNTKHRKLSMEYKGKRFAGCTITPQEREYIANDVLVVKEALQLMFEEGHNELTIGACCLKEFKSIMGKYDYETFFPRLDTISIDPEIYGSSNVDEYIRHSYRGGWCYRVKGAERIKCKKGVTADVNSLYPSMMHSQSGNYYPVCKPKFWSGNFIPEEATINHRYYFVRIKTRFYIKDGKLPFIQIKHNHMYKSTQMQETSDVYNKSDGKYYTSWIDKDGLEHDTRLTMTMTCIDFELFLEHYDVKEFEILDGCWFRTEIGLFDGYIDKYKEIKMHSKGGKRQIAKLFLNNLYGKMATSTVSSFKYASINDDVLKYSIQEENAKKPVYIAIGSAITSYSRNFTIRAAQMNYYGADKNGFKYADTDSIHCDIDPSQIRGIRIDDNDFCAWKLESFWDEAIFLRQKTYVEHVTHEDGKPIDTPYYNIKCAGMPDKCKKLFIESMKPQSEINLENRTEDEKQFLSKHRTIDDFTYGLTIPDKLLPRVIKGGVILEDTYFTLLK